MTQDDVGSERLETRAIGESSRPSDAILRALEGSGVDLTDVTAPLGDRVDLDAVDDVVDRPDSEVRLSFSAYGRQVVVDDDRVCVYRDDGTTDHRPSRQLSRND
jgi:hypothetical protein